MRLRDVFPEAIPGPFAHVYALGPGRLLRPAQERVAALVAEALPAAATRVVDAGCGPGWLTIALARRLPALEVVGVDLSPSMIAIARRNAASLANVRLLCENVTALSLADDSVDHLVSSESMHHWRDPVAALDELHRVLKPGGVAWIFDGRDDFSPEELEAWLGRRIPRWLPRRLADIPRRVLSLHGFDRRGWEEDVPRLVGRSRFRRGETEKLGIYRRLTLRKPALAAD